jgi:hypothetical protein
VKKDFVCTTDCEGFFSKLEESTKRSGSDHPSPGITNSLVLSFSYSGQKNVENHRCHFKKGFVFFFFLHRCLPR